MSVLLFYSVAAGSLAFVKKKKKTYAHLTKRTLWQRHILAAGLMAGLFYAYSCSVNPGLQRLSDAGYLAPCSPLTAPF